MHAHRTCISPTLRSVTIGAHIAAEKESQGRSITVVYHRYISSSRQAYRSHTKNITHLLKTLGWGVELLLLLLIADADADADGGGAAAADTASGAALTTAVVVADSVYTPDAFAVANRICEETCCLQSA